MDEYKLKINFPRRCTELVIQSDHIAFRCFISNVYSPRNRRQMLLSLYRVIIPHLEFVRRSTIHHLHHEPPDIFNKDEFAQLSLKQGIHITDNQSKIGYYIRGIRTKLGKTQKVFAQELGISANYLSLMERGVRAPSPKLMRKIYEIK